jgi:carboxyl-terminal processing protease
VREGFGNKAAPTWPRAIATLFSSRCGPGAHCTRSRDPGFVGLGSDPDKPSCRRGDASLVSSRPSTINSAAQAYLNSALDIMQKNSLRSRLTNWSALRRGTLAMAAGARTTADTYPAIRWALSQLGDNHSFFLTPAQVRAMQQGTLAPNLPPEGERLPGGVGLVKLSAVEGGAMQSDYGTLLQQAIARIDRTATCGWVVDLRGNLGGDMWPMLAGVGPILGAGVVGHFISAQATQTWTYARGQAAVDGTVIARVTVPYTLKRPMPPVAVLTDSQTASSGEAIAVAFRGRPDTRSFGQATYGVPTANQEEPLADGPIMVLTVAEDADRTGRRYDGPIPPDQFVPAAPGGASDTPADPVVQAAVSWLDHQPACASADQGTTAREP